MDTIWHPIRHFQTCEKENTQPIKTNSDQRRVLALTPTLKVIKTACHMFECSVEI